MTINENLVEFAGCPVEDYDRARGLERPGEVAYRLRLDWDSWEDGLRLPELLAAVLDDPRVSELQRLVIGAWDFEANGGVTEIIAAIAAGAAKLPALEALFFGDITYEEQEISWIEQGDVTPLFESLPNLKVLRIRGGTGLAMHDLRHERLEELALETGGLRRSVTKAVAEGHFPRLRKLELWFGDENYGYESPFEELGPILDGSNFPELRYLGLKNCAEQDAVAKAVAGAPILKQLDVLDLSLGTLTDAGAAALVASPLLAKVGKLDISHHFVSPELVEQLRAVVGELDASGRREEERYGDEVWRYVAVSE